MIFFSSTLMRAALKLIASTPVSGTLGAGVNFSAGEDIVAAGLTGGMGAMVFATGSGSGLGIGFAMIGLARAIVGTAAATVETAGATVGVIFNAAINCGAALSGTIAIPPGNTPLSVAFAFCDSGDGAGVGSSKTNILFVSLSNCYWQASQSGSVIEQALISAVVTPRLCIKALTVVIS